MNKTVCPQCKKEWESDWCEQTACIEIFSKCFACLNEEKRLTKDNIARIENKYRERFAGN